jgi:Xaa-Pro aminopeptidase
MSNFSRRRELVRERLGATADALLVTEPLNVRYLTGFTGSNAQLLLDEAPVFFTDGRYEEQAGKEVPDLERMIYSGSTKLGDLLKDVGAGRGLKRLGVEQAHLTLGAAERLREALEGFDLVPTKEVVEPVRARKDEREIEAIARAQELAERSLVEALARWEGGTEADLALAIEWAIRTGGAEAVSFDVIVATGAHSALPHATPRRERADAEAVLLIDIGARLDGYCSDMTRTYLGPRVPAELRDAHEAVLAALDAACAAVGPGVKAADVDAAARSVLEERGLAERFVHSTGHGVGLAIHEAPSLNATSEEVLEPGMVVTVEPGVYLPGVGGVRIEDLLVVTEDGATNLTKLDRSSEVPRQEAAWQRQ